MDDGTTYRSRDFDEEAHQRYLRQLLDGLADDARATDPRRAASASGKDHRAFSALLVAGELVDAVAGWAIDDVYGLSLAGRKMLPSQPMGSLQHPTYVESRVQADSHEHENRGGAAIDEDVRPMLPAERRLILRNLVFAGAGGFPPWLRCELLESLDALDAGSRLPLLEPSRKISPTYEKARAQLEMTGFVRFRSDAYSTSVDEAFEFVASRINIGADTLKKWEQRIRKSCLGELEVERYLRFVRNAASYVKEATRTSRAGETISPFEKTASERRERQFGVAGLTEAAARWRNL